MWPQFNAADKNVYKSTTNVNMKVCRTWCKTYSNGPSPNIGGLWLAFSQPLVACSFRDKNCKLAVIRQTVMCSKINDAVCLVEYVDILHINNADTITLIICINWQLIKQLILPWNKHCNCRDRNSWSSLWHNSQR